MRTRAASGTTFGAAYERYDGPLCSNYECSIAAVAYLISRTSAKAVIMDFVTSRQCRQVFEAADPSAGFEAAFGIGLTQFYADFNAWLTDGSKSASELSPTRASVESLFAHCTLCSDLCDDGKATGLSGNGECDATCASYGADCSDCGRSTRPAALPVTLTDHPQSSSRRLRLGQLESKRGPTVGLDGARVRPRRRMTVSEDGTWCVSAEA